MSSLEEDFARVSRCVVQNGGPEEWEAIQSLRNALLVPQNDVRTFVFAGPNPDGLFMVGDPDAPMFMPTTRHAQPVLALVVCAVKRPGRRVDANDLYRGTRQSAARACVFDQVRNAIGQIERYSPGLYRALWNDLRIVADDKQVPHIVYLPSRSAVIRT